MSDREPIAHQVNREIEALAELRRSRPRLFWIVLLGMAVLSVLYVYDKFWGIPKLKEEISEKDKRILLLETQIAPFRAVAIDRFPGDESQALARLATQFNDLRERFEKSEKLIRRFDAGIRVNIQGQWTGGKIPNLTGRIRITGGSPSARVTFQSINREIREIIFEDVSEPRFLDLGSGVASLEYRVSAPVGSWVMGQTSDEFLSCREAAIRLYGIGSQTVSGDEVLIQSMNIQFFVNGKESFHCNLVVDAHLKVSPESKQDMEVFWKGNINIENNS
jgi:hypothetical protein